MQRKRNEKRNRLLRVFALDAVAFGICLVVFAYFHHVRKPALHPTALPVTTPQATPSPTPAPSAEPDAPTPSPTPSGLLGGKYAEKFSQDGVVQTETEYRSENLAIELRTEYQYESVIHVAEIFMQDLSCFRTGVYDQFGDDRLRTLEMGEEAGAILALSGDYFTAHLNHAMYIVRNGLVYSGKQPESGYDTCVLYFDGTMETIPADQFDKDAVLKRGLYQSWCFGPGLLTAGGAPIENFHSSVKQENPRSAIGYYEPGHYCFVMVEGRNGNSKGMTLAQLSEFFASLGCQAAYNLDGGKTAEMAFNGQLVNPRLGDGRAVSDILYIYDPENQEMDPA